MSSRPDIGILCYPVITMGEWTHRGSFENLLGKNPSPELVKEVSNEQHVTSDTPCCFIFATSDDPVVPVENSLMFADALRRAGVPFDLHIYQHGPHGIGLGAKIYDPEHMHPWTHDCHFWLKEQKFAR
jgi:dipeptidyl aminopeptidase/acylaminoacyl peptidase